jgi:8-hydroxy-5-deazaflavin:NADPH oxidoreductase
MKIGILGTGVVARTIGGKLLALGHEVKLGSRNAEHPQAREWAATLGERASVGTFADAAGFGELVFNCTNGSGSVPALRAARSQLEGKLLLDVTNPLDFSQGMPPILFTGSTDSLGEMAQRELPGTHVVKTLNTVNCDLMVDARSVADGEHHMFVAGNDAAAKAKATELLQTWFGWKHVLDLGDIGAARGMESYVALWIRLWGSQTTPSFNLRIVR